ncbi:MAG: hypothetical protein ABSG01_02070 [Anaerolineales bacterium]|jgi:hypothetical protein
MILAFKLIVSPFFIGMVTLAGRKWGPNVSGLLMGLPLTSAPISVFLAIQFGAAFAARSASGNLAGQASVCIFCLAYSLGAQKLNWFPCTIISLVSFLVSTFIWNRIPLTLLPAVALLGIVICLVLWLMPRGNAAILPISPPRWDLPARMLLAAAFVIALTTFADTLGPHLSGLIAPFPVFGTIITAFTHRQQGADAATRLLRGIVFGSLAYTAFFLIAGSLLTHVTLGWTYILASVAALFVSGITFIAPGIFRNKHNSAG